jgi:uncharacterized membrane protein (DUF106 family)
MSFVNAALRPVFDLILYPFRGLPPLVGLVIVSLVAAIGMLLVFKATSNQEALASTKRQIHAGLFEIRLFSDDLGAILRAQGGILRHNLTYLRLSLVPMVWMIVPLFFVIAQLQFHYGYEGLRPGSTTLLTVELAEASGDEASPAHLSSGKPAIRLEMPSGLRVDSPPVWVPTLREMTWRIAADDPGSYEVKVHVDESTATKSVVVTSELVRRSPIRVDSGIVSPIRSISITYPDRSIEIFRLGLHWLIVFFVLSIVFAFMLRGRFDVTI